MMRTRKGLTVLTFILSLALCLGTVSALAFEVDPDREFTAKYDKVFEDFDRESTADTVTVSGAVTDGGKGFLRVPLSETNAGDGVDGENIYKHATGGESASRGNLVVEVRSQDAVLADIKIQLRYADGIFSPIKSLADMKDSEGANLPAIGAEWTKLIVNFANSYEADEFFTNDKGESNGVSVASGMFIGLHLFTAADVTGKTLDINKIYYTTDDNDANANSRTWLNNFVGGGTLEACAKAVDSGFFWNGSAGGTMVKRAYTVETDGVLTVVNEANKSTGYTHAVIEYEGEGTAKVQTTTDGTTWSAESDLTRVIAAQDGTYGFKITGKTGSLVVKRIFFTNFEVEAIATEYPTIDPLATQKFDDFLSSQSGFTNNYDDMTGETYARALLLAGMNYRLSYSHGGGVTIANGVMTLDMTGIPAGEHINYKAEAKNAAVGFKYVVFKIKGESGGTLDTFRFGIGKAGAGQTTIRWCNGDVKSAPGLSVPALGSEDYGYTADGYQYIIADIEESGLDNPAEGIATLDMYYSGSGKLIIDEIFFANDYAYAQETVGKVQVAFDDVTDGQEYTGTGEAYQYLGYAYAPNKGARYMAVTVSGTATLSDIRFEFVGGETVWFAAAQAKHFVDKDGNVIPTELTETEQTYIIDLVASDVDLGFDAFHVHGGNIESGKTITFKATLQNYMNEMITTEDVTFDEAAEKVVTGSGAAYQYLGYATAANKGAYPYLELTVSGTATLSDVRFSFAEGDIWFISTQEKHFVDIFGNTIPMEIPEGGATYYIDLIASGIAPNFDGFHMHGGNIPEGDTLTISARLFANEHDFAYIMEKLPVYSELPDIDAPTLTVTVPATATEGDTIQIQYTATDNKSATDKITIEIVVKKGADIVTLTADHKFTAEAGTYTVTVTATDEAGNPVTETKQITVGEKPETPPAAGCGCGTVGLGSMFGGGMAILCGAFLLTVFLLLRRGKKTVK